MHKTALIFLGLALCTAVEAVQWKTYEEALKLAQEHNKSIMIDAVRTGCHYCDDMQHNVFDDANMSQWIEARFIPVKINISDEALPLGLKVGMTPSFLFISKEQEFIKKIPGSWNQEDFKSLLKEVIHE